MHAIRYESSEQRAFLLLVEPSDTILESGRDDRFDHPGRDDSRQLAWRWNGTDVDNVVIPDSSLQVGGEGVLQAL
jgi:beta-lactamase superfamily II metal-dependent hydrolase